MLSNAITGFEVASIDPWDLVKVKMKNISPGNLCHPEELLLMEVAANVSTSTGGISCEGSPLPGAGSPVPSDTPTF